MAQAIRKKSGSKPKPKAADLLRVFLRNLNTNTKRKKPIK